MSEMSGFSASRTTFPRLRSADEWAGCPGSESRVCCVGGSPRSWRRPRAPRNRRPWTPPRRRRRRRPDHDDGLDDTARSTASTTTTSCPGEVPPTTDTTLPPPPEDPAANADSPPETVPDVDLIVPPREIAALRDHADGPLRRAAPPSPPSPAASCGSARAPPGPAPRRPKPRSTPPSPTATSSSPGRRSSRPTSVGSPSRSARRSRRSRTRSGTSRERAADAYIRGNFVPVRSFLVSDTAGEFYYASSCSPSCSKRTSAPSWSTREARDAVDAEQAATAVGARQRRQRARRRRTSRRRRRSSSTSSPPEELAVFLNGGSFVIHGFAFPVAAGYSYGDSFGAPRMLGTEFEHWHEGTDILAPIGTELVACERGVITQHGLGRARRDHRVAQGRERDVLLLRAPHRVRAGDPRAASSSRPAPCSATSARRATRSAGRRTSTSRSTRAAVRRSTRTRSSGWRRIRRSPSPSAC